MEGNSLLGSYWGVICVEVACSTDSLWEDIEYITSWEEEKS